MTTLDHLTEEVRQLTAPELAEFRAWITNYKQPESTSAEPRRADWSDHDARMREIFGDNPTPRENVVLALREEERY